MSRRNVLIGLAAAYAVLAVLVATGVLNGVDQWALDHVMPGAGGPVEGPSVVESLVPLIGAHWGSGLQDVANVVTLPGQGLVSLAILAALRRPKWLAAWLAVNVVELLCKTVIVRPPLYHDGAHVLGFDSSFPSGHTLRTLLVAAALASVWPRARWPLAAWAAASLALLVVAGHHVPSDIVGGAVLAGFVLALLPRGRAARALGARGLRAPPRGAR